MLRCTAKPTNGTDGPHPLTRDDRDDRPTPHIRSEVPYDFAERSGDPDVDDVRQLVVVRNGQHVFNEVVDRYLRRVEFADDGYAQLIRLPGYQSATVVVDPTRGFGQPIFGSGGATVEDALSMFWAGESLADAAIEYGVPEAKLEDALRVSTRHAA